MQMKLSCQGDQYGFIDSWKIKSIHYFRFYRLSKMWQDLQFRFWPPRRHRCHLQMILSLTPESVHYFRFYRLSKMVQQFQSRRRRGIFLVNDFWTPTPPSKLCKSPNCREIYKVFVSTFLAPNFFSPSWSHASTDVPSP